MKKEEPTNQPEESIPSTPPVIPDTKAEPIIELSVKLESSAVPHREILVTLPRYSCAVKRALKDGSVKIGNQDLKPGLTYRLKDSEDIQNAIKEGKLIRISGSFGPKEREARITQILKVKPKEKILMKLRSMT